MSFLKKIVKEVGNNINYVNANIELDKLKKERDSLIEDFKDIQQRRNLFLKYQDEKEKLKNIIMINSKFLSDYECNLNLFVDDTNENIKNINLTIIDTLRNSNNSLVQTLTNFTKLSDMDDNKFIEKESEHNIKLNKIKEKLEKVRKIVH